MIQGSAAVYALACSIDRDRRAFVRYWRWPMLEKDFLFFFFKRSSHLI